MLLLMAIIPIYIGSHLSVTQQEKQKNKDENTEEVEVMTSNDAMMFPLVASCALFGLYVLFKVFGKEYVNLLMGGYFFILGVMSLTKALRFFVLMVTPVSFTKLPFTFSLTQEVDVTEKKTEETEEEKDEGVNEPSKVHVIFKRMHSFILHILSEYLCSGNTNCPLRLCPLHVPIPKFCATGQEGR